VPPLGHRQHIIVSFISCCCCCCCYNTYCTYSIIRKSDLKRSESTLRRLLQLSPKHVTGTLQLARLLTDVYLVRAKQKTDTTATQYEAITLEVCFLYERYMELIGDVRDTLLYSTASGNYNGVYAQHSREYKSFYVLIIAKCGGGGVHQPHRTVDDEATEGNTTCHYD